MRATLDGFDQFIANPTSCGAGDCSRGVSDITDQYGVHIFTVFHGPDGNGPIQKGSPFGFTIGGSPNAYGQLGPDFSGIEFRLPRLVSSVSVDASQYSESDAEFYGLAFHVLDKNGHELAAQLTSYSSGLLPGYGEKVLTFTSTANNIAALVDDYGHQYGIYFDNLTFGYSDPSLIPTATPEPATLTLFTGSGFLLLGWAFRRKRRS